MASAAPPGLSADARLRGELGRAARSIRLADASGGLLALVAIVLGYAAVMILADRFAELPAWARGLGLGTALVLAGVVGYVRVWRPLSRTLNPRYAARQVEAAAPGAKNAVINWVDLENEQLAENVRTLLSARAATGVASADARKLSESRLVTGSLVACGVLIAVLAGLFIWLSPASFYSLLTRAFNPITTKTIATRSELVLGEPAGGDATIYVGDPLKVRVTVNGRVPGGDSADRPRLLIRRTDDAAAVAEEYPLPALGAREFGADLAGTDVGTGFRYVVAAGDARTPEYRVAVRPRPKITAYEVVATPPAYTRLKPELTTDPRVAALRGSQIELTVAGNRPLKGGELRLTTQAVPVASEPVAGSPEKLRFRFGVEKSGVYRVTFTTAEGEVGDPTDSHTLFAIADAKPTVTVSRPEAENAQLPLSGRLEVDGQASDDFGVVSATLRMQIAGTPPALFTPVKYRGGKSFRRADGSFPFELAVKLSTPVAGLKLQSGEPADIKVGTVLEYWLEATDNCTLPTANVGRSALRKVTIAAPPAPEQQAEQQKREQERDGEEQAHGQKQDEQFQNEPRNKPQQNAQPQPGQAGQPGEKPPEPKDGQQPQSNAGRQQGTSGGNPPPQAGQPSAAEKPPGEETQPNPPQGRTPPPKSTDAKPEPANPPAGQQNQEPSGQQPKNSSGSQSGGAEPKTGGDAQPANAKPPGSSDSADPKPQNGAAPRPSDGKPEANPKTSPAGKTDGSSTPEAQRRRDEAQRVQNAINGKQEPESRPKPPTDAQRQEIEDAARDLASGDKTKQDAARQKLDDLVGKENRERAEAEANQIKNDLNSSDKATREAAEQKVKDAVEQMQKQAGDKSANDAGQAARDLNSPDAARREAAKNTLDKKVGPEARQELEKQASAADAQQQAGDQSGADKSRERLADQAAEMARKQSQAGGKQDAQAKQEIQDAAKDLASNDPATREKAEKKLDDLVGMENRKAAQAKAEQLKNDLNSADDATRKKAEKEVADLAKAAGEPEPKQKGEVAPKPKDTTAKSNENPTGESGTKPGEGQPEQPPMPDPAGKPGNSNPASDPKKEPDRKTDPQANLGKKGVTKPGNQESAPQNGTTPGEAKQGDQSGGQAGKPPAQPNGQPPQIGDKPGQGGQKQQGPNGNPPAGGNPPKSNGQPPADAGQPGQEQSGGKPQPGKPDAAKQQELAKAANDLANGTPAEKDAARQKLDKEIGKGNREQVERDAKQLADDLKSGDPATKQAAQKKLNDLKEKMVEQAQANKPNEQPKAGEQEGNQQPGEGPQPTPEQRAEFEKKAKDLNSDEPKAKKAAEDEFDQAIGKQAREDLQQAQKDAQAAPPQTRDEAQKRLQSQMDRAAQQSGKQKNPGGQGVEREGDRLVENEKNRLKTAELQLADLNKAKDDVKLQQRLGYTPEQYAAFLKGVEQAVKDQRAAVAKLEDDVKKAAGRATVGVGGTRNVTNQNGTSGGNGAGPGVPPEGFADALKRFGQEVNQSK